MAWILFQNCWTIISNTGIEMRRQLTHLFRRFSAVRCEYISMVKRMHSLEYEWHQSCLIAATCRFRVTYVAQFRWARCLPPAPVSMTVIYCSRNDRSLRHLEYSLISIYFFVCTMGLAAHRHRLKPCNNDKNFNILKRAGSPQNAHSPF